MITFIGSGNPAGSRFIGGSTMFAVRTAILGATIAAAIAGELVLIARYILAC